MNRYRVVQAAAFYIMFGTIIALSYHACPPVTQNNDNARFLARTCTTLPLLMSGSVPTAPLELTAKGYVPGYDMGVYVVSLAWNAPAGNGSSAITHYNIYRGRSAGNETLLKTLGVVFTYMDWVLNQWGTEPGPTCYYKVQAQNSDGMGANSTECRVVWCPTAPQNVQVAGGDGQVVLSWQSPASNGGSPIIGYHIYRSISPMAWQTMYATIGNVTTYTDTGVTNGQTYYYTIAAINAIGEGSYIRELQASTSMAPYKIVLIIVAIVAVGVAITVIILKINKTHRKERTERKRQGELERQQRAEAARQRQLEAERQHQSEAARQQQLEAERQQQAEQGRIEKLKKLVMVSEKLKISQMAQIMGMEDAALYDRIVDWADQFGFTIDQDVVKFSTGRKDDFIAALDDAFSGWSGKEKDKDGKLE